MRYDGPFYRALTLLSELVVLNLCVVLTLIPVVTGGMGLDSLASVTRQMAADEGSRRTRTFLARLGEQWRVVTVFWLAALALGVIAAWELAVVGHGVLDERARWALSALILSGAGVVAIIAGWFFSTPGGRFTDRVAAAVARALRHPWRSLAIGVLFAAPWVGLYAGGGWRVLVGYAVIGIAATYYLIALILPPAPAVLAPEPAGGKGEK